MKQEIKIVNCFLLFLTSILVFTSCRKGELPIPAPIINSKGAGELVTCTVDMSSTYENQIYFDLSSNSNKGQSHKDDWDLRFSCNSATPYIVMNAAKVMLTAKIESGTFENITNTSSLSSNSRAEHSSGRIDSIAVKNGTLFVFDRGYNAIGFHSGYFKMEIIEHTSTHFTGRFANINGSNEQTITIPKNTDYNFVYMKWSPSGSITNPTVEPVKEGWDLVFTQFTHIFPPPDNLNYSVVGCLTNTYNTLSYKVTDGTGFEDIDYEYASNLILSNDRDIVGYDWKTFLYDQNKFVVHSEKVYIIKDHEGDFYKLRFIDFYNMTGEKGAPTFEYQRL